MPEQCSLVRMTSTLVSLKTKAFNLIKLDARPSLPSKRIILDLNQIWLYLMELPATKTVPPLLLLKALNGAPDLECLPLLLLLKRLGQAGGQSEAFRERFLLMLKQIADLHATFLSYLIPLSTCK